MLKMLPYVHMSLLSAFNPNHYNSFIEHLWFNHHLYIESSLNRNAPCTLGFLVIINGYN